ncbi:YdcF family protein [Mucilaginibacter sp. PPCGB 2223]|uniref:YdcF family protein n=1 Tax=Mucilaginibacter sp. PPCGB 2223 TaxID=1886027 RepID=UPI001586C28D|nr:YdcF family protein [Mucilaginibacter sp. PPCGB 2223]
MITPFFWVCCLLVSGLISKQPKIKKRFFIASAAVFLIFSNPLLLRRFAGYWNYPPVQVSGKYSCAILLGGFASEKGNGKGYFNESCDRFIEATELKTTGTISHVLISSGNSSLRPDGFREADWVKTQLLKFNVPDSAILVEHDSRNTFENAEFSKKVLQARHLQPPYLLVTGAYHMRRALYIFKKAGVPVIPYPAEYFSVNKSFSFEELIPQPGILSAWNTYTKEVIGYAMSSFK